MTVVTDKATIERFNQIVCHQLEKAHKMPGAILTRRGKTDLRFHFFTLRGMVASVGITAASNQRHRMLFADLSKPDEPAFNLIINEGGQLEVEFAGSSEQQPDVSEKLKLAESLTVGLGSLVPYGWVEDDRITTLLYCTDVEPWERDGVTINSSGLDCFVVEGAMLPEELLMSKGESSWISRIWELITDGKLVRLSERIHNLPGEVWAKSDGKQQPWIEFDCSDGQSPAFVTNAPYGFWHPLERSRGELYGNNTRGMDAGWSSPLKEWFI